MCKMMQPPLAAAIVRTYGDTVKEPMVGMKRRGVPHLNAASISGLCHLSNHAGTAGRGKPIPCATPVESNGRYERKQHVL